MRSLKITVISIISYLLTFSLLSFAEPNSYSVHWPLWDSSSPEPHTVFGEPAYIKHDPNHMVTRNYEAFTVYYDDSILSPRWTAIKLTHQIADKNSDIKRQHRFKVDTTIKNMGFQTTTHKDYNNPVGIKKWNRGHMVQFDDARGYGQQAAKDSFYTTNICPQLALHNQAGWLSLEQMCTEFARDYQVAWIYSGPIYDDHPEPFAPERKIPAPIAFYKIIVSPGDDNSADVLAFRLPHIPIARNADLSEYLTSIRAIEDETGINFLHELPDDYENYIESAVWEIWPDLPND